MEETMLVSIVQMSPVFLDKEATIRKLADFIVQVEDETELVT